MTGVQTCALPILLSHIEDYLIKELEIQANDMRDEEDVMESWERRFENKLSGGFGDKKKLSDFDPKEVKMGLEVEREHTDEKKLWELKVQVLCIY